MKLIKLINKSPRNYMAFDIILKAGEVLEIKDSKIANILLTQPEVEEYIDPEEVKKLKDELKELKKETKSKKS